LRSAGSWKSGKTAIGVGPTADRSDLLIAIVASRSLRLVGTSVGIAGGHIDWIPVRRYVAHSWPDL
jgi:hypothetical protein